MSFKERDTVNKIKTKIKEYECFVKYHPERKGVKCNIKTLKQIFKELNE